MTQIFTVTGSVTFTKQLGSDIVRQFNQRAIFKVAVEGEHSREEARRVIEGVLIESGGSLEGVEVWLVDDDEGIEARDWYLTVNDEVVEDWDEIEKWQDAGGEGEEAEVALLDIDTVED